MITSAFFEPDCSLKITMCPVSPEDIGHAQRMLSMTDYGFAVKAEPEIGEGAISMIIPVSPTKVWKSRSFNCHPLALAFVNEQKLGAGEVQFLPLTEGGVTVFYLAPKK
jgi:hypothetical protein